MPTIYRILRLWIWEILSIITAIGLIVAIALLLAIYDGKPAPDWGERINFNALLAVLSTILRAMLVVVASQVISERKWSWLETKRQKPLSDVERFDAGSRGSAGAILLLRTVWLGDVITATAGLVLFTSFLVGPSIQQASRTTDCTVVAPGANASLPFAHYVPRRGGFTMDYTGQIAASARDITTTVLSAVLSPGGIEHAIHTSCSTGNCTFPFDSRREPRKKSSPVRTDSIVHSTVGMCAKCTDVTSLAVRNATSCESGDDRFSLPGDFSVWTCSNIPDIARLGSMQDLAWMGELLTPELRAASRWAYINATFLTMTDWTLPNVTVAATVCTLYPCVRSYVSSIENNILSETEIANTPMQVDTSSHSRLPHVNTRCNSEGDYTAVISPCSVNDQVYDRAKNMSEYTNGTRHQLEDFVDYGKSESYPSVNGNITAPEPCIYRHDHNFVRSIATLLNDQIFTAYCVAYRSVGCEMAKDSASSLYQSLGPTTAIFALYNNGYGDLTNVSK